MKHPCYGSLRVAVSPLKGATPAPRQSRLRGVPRMVPAFHPSRKAPPAPWATNMQRALSGSRCGRQGALAAFGPLRSLVCWPYGHVVGQRAGRPRPGGRIDVEAVDCACLVCHALARGRGSVVNGRRVYSRLPQRSRPSQGVDAAALAHQEQSLASDPEHSHGRPAALPTMVASRYQGKPTTATGRKQATDQARALHGRNVARCLMEPPA